MSHLPRRGYVTVDISLIDRLIRESGSTVLVDWADKPASMPETAIVLGAHFDQDSRALRIYYEDTHVATPDDPEPTEGVVYLPTQLPGQPMVGVAHLVALRQDQPEITLSTGRRSWVFDRIADKWVEV